MPTSAAKTYVTSLDISGTPRGFIQQDAVADAGKVFDDAKNQAQIVASGVFSFAIGVDEAVREAISDSALLAQLVANKKASQITQTDKWFNEYATVLQNVGWVVQDGSFTDYTNQGTAAEVHEQLLSVLTVALGPSVAAVALIKATMDALHAMKPDSPWLTLFSRESQKAKMARFQIGLVEKDGAGDVFVSLIAVVIDAKDTVTQVLFFKFRKAKAKFRANAQKVSINKASLSDLGPTIRAKVRAYQHDYLSSVLDLA